MRKRIVAGNWKMNTTPQQGLALAQDVRNLSSGVPNEVELIVAPPFTHITSIVTELNQSRVKVAAQNCSSWEKGAYTGEVAPAMIASSGAVYVIIGHSERREYFGETGEILLNKVKLALQNGLSPIFCCGEKLEERDANRHFQVVENQLAEVLSRISQQEMKNVIVAYEPVWAIGTGRTATPDQAQEMHNFIRKIIEKQHGKEIANGTSILYGGSCKPDNAKEIFAKPDVDGGLIGGASLVASDFIAIAKSFPEK